jgi:predicted enzyme related to lactoylglutathione lyase
MAPLLASAALLALGLTATAHAAAFPPINSPATSEHRPGKFIWADLFTSNPTAATKFYSDLFGWTPTVIDQKGKSYTIFTNDGVPVAGLAPHSFAKQDTPSRWIGYLAVNDAKATVAAVKANGGVVHAPVRKFSERGYQAIIGEKEGVPIGILQSTSGDPTDDETKPGEWNWFEFYVRDPQATANFYHQVLNIEVAVETRSERKSDFTLSSGGSSRGGIAPLPDADAKPSWLGVIRVADLDLTLAKVGGLGGEILVQPHTVEFGSRFAIILDSTGGTIGLVQYIDSENPAKSP